jgi:hypothetical protein
MPQETNLNVSPYFDDFDLTKNYYKVLFKPGYPVQARELTGLQSILQNQIEQFGNHVFTEGSVVIPGSLSYNVAAFGVKLENTFNGVNVDTYIDNLLNKVIIGQDSGVKAKVVYILKQNESDNSNTILYLNYLNTSDSGNFQFSDSENLLVEETVSPGFSELTSIQANQAFATSFNIRASILGSLVNLSEGVYFLRGAFVSVSPQTLVLDAEGTIPSYKVGFVVLEEIINSDIDDSLVDNARGFSNYAAPGADRLKISAILSKIPLSETQSNNFVTILTLNNGLITDFKVNPDFNILGQEFARRTFDESGDYYVKPFKLEIKNSLNDRKGNGGIFNDNQITYQGNVPSDSLGSYIVSPGKAYITGYETELLAPTIIDFEKPRTTNTLTNQSIIYSTGATYSLNRVYGSPSLGISTSFTVSLRDSRLGENQYTSSGKEIGIARVYDFALESGSYNSALPNTNEWDISLYDIQTYTEISLNEPITLSTPTYIKGKSTGATGFLRYSASNSGIITAYNVNGTFAIGEKFIFDGIENNRVATAITSYGTNDVKSLYGVTGSGTTFTADTKQYTSVNVGLVNITPRSSGISTVSTSDLNFVGVATVGNIVAFTSAGLTVPVFAKIQSVSEKSLTISGITTVTGICEGALPSTNISPSDFRILKSRFLSSSDNTLYTKLGKQFVSSVDLTDSQLTIKKQFDVVISSNSLTITPTEILSNEIFLPFDEERYVLIRDDGNTEPLSADKFVFTSGGKELTINGLEGSGNARLIATLRKTEIKSRVKNKNRVKSLLINKSSLNSSSANNDGLVFGNYPYGTRIQDDQICLNVPEVTKLYAIFESNGIQDPTAPILNLQNISSTSATSSEIIIGEEIVGEQSGSVAICVEKPSSLSIGYVYLNNIPFIEGETVTFKESGTTAEINSVVSGSNNIASNYTLNNGQRSTILDYSRIVRKTTSLPPTRKIKVYYESAYIPTSDTGDITIVNSYDQFDYCDLQSVDGNSVSNIVDCRPRVDNYDPDSSSYSPFEFFGRSFDQDQNSSLDVLASDESIILDYSFYLGRIDRVYLSSRNDNSRISQSYNRNPILLVKQGIPSEFPQLPDEVSGSLEIARVTLPPYLCNPQEARITLVDHKRYRMIDISKLERRITDLEFYSSLTLLENNAKNLQIKDSSGLDRFKSGIFVDNFSTNSYQTENYNSYKNSIDRANNELRPSSFTTEIDLLLGSNSLLGIGTISNPDIKYVTDLIGNNIRRSGTNPDSTGKGIITLDYREVLEIDQPFASRIESVTPYLITEYIGQIDLNPSSDIWVDQVKIEPLTVEGLGGIVTRTQLEATDFDPQAGFSPVDWNSWETNWTGTTTSSGTQTVGNQAVINSSIVRTGTQTRRGTSTREINTTNNVSIGNRVVNVDVSPSIRSRNIEFNAKKLRPFTRVYPFFDSRNVSNYVIPKLIEIEMLEGSFVVGETVSNSNTTFRARCAAINHRYGPFNNPTSTYETNPYSQGDLIPSQYSSNSTILNIDTTSLADFSVSDFFGNISIGMILVGQTSGSRARITNVRLISDRSGVIIGSFFVPDPNDSSNPSFNTGTKTFKLTSNSTNSPLPGELVDSRAESNFFADGLITQNQETTLALRNTEIQTVSLSESRPITETINQTFAVPLPTQTIIREVEPTRRDGPPPEGGNWLRGGGDPLAQSFIIGDDINNTGRYITGVDLYFQKKDNVVPVFVELRPMSLGTPTLNAYPFGIVYVYPDQINLSDDGSVPTRVNFPAPVFLEGGKEHALIVGSDSTEYTTFISRLGEIDISTTLGQEASQVFVEKQPTLGSLFKSQNASTWTPSQYEDLKFSLYSARFVEQGSITFFNPELNENNKQVATLRKDSLELNSRRIRVGLGTTLRDSGLEIGNRISQSGSNATGIYVGAGGSVTGNLQIINAGIGYTPSSGSLTYNNVSLTSVTGTGRDAKANITIQNGVAIAATVSIGGTGYSIGDVLTASSIGINSLGRNLRLSVVGIAGTNEITIDNVQGDFVVGVGNSLFYSSVVAGSGTTAINGGGVFITSSPIVESDGMNIKINHRNHGMHSPTNDVIISRVESDVPPATLTSEYLSTSTDSISISPGFTTSFSTFENVGVGTTNLGYVLIDNEIISYSGVVGNLLTGITRGVDSTIPLTHSINSLVYKYELGGVSLRRINKTHKLQDATVDDPIGLDYYNIKVDMSSNGVNRTTGINQPKLYVNSTKSAGGSNIKATQNIQFEIVKPIIQTVIHPETQLRGEIRTTSGTSISGSEISFLDQGFEPLSLDENNYFSTPRIVASRVNETGKLINNLGNKSTQVRLNLSTTDSRLTPSIDLDRVGLILVSNRVNNVVTDFIADDRVSTVKDDPSAFIYATRPISLEIPATSIKIIVSAYINPYSDLRALYSILKDPSEEPIYNLFPGYSNKLESGQVINPANNDGTSDTFVSKNDTLGFDSNEITFKDYEFTIDNLESFRYFSIKLVGTSTNQSYPPRLRDLRVIATA